MIYMRYEQRKIVITSISFFVGILLFIFGIFGFGTTMRMGISTDFTPTIILSIVGSILILLFAIAFISYAMSYMEI